jgi:hypothetical protein
MWKSTVNAAIGTPPGGKSVLECPRLSLITKFMINGTMSAHPQSHV